MWSNGHIDVSILTSGIVAVHSQCTDTPPTLFKMKTGVDNSIVHVCWSKLATLRPLPTRPSMSSHKPPHLQRRQQGHQNDQSCQINLCLRRSQLDNNTYMIIGYEAGTRQPLDTIAIHIIQDKDTRYDRGPDGRNLPSTRWRRPDVNKLDFTASSIESDLSPKYW